ncbi:tyrosine-type recombinase/integrase [Amorphus sp. 3PC139-8]|uniref:tyrosine-type recombinase/integrase n=1 Tax=Amorphus sp. 3PC139-8 TaxID=2735676 RepID=UPI00345CE3C0
MEQFERYHPVGSMARLAFALLLYTGQRRSDVIRFGPQHIRNGWLTFTQHKGRNRKPVKMELPILTVLREIIEATPGRGQDTFVVTRFGKSFADAGFGNWFAKRCDEAGVPGRAHGLRKAAAARLAELGCSDREIMAVTGHTTTKEIDRYTRSARQRLLAQAALSRLEAGNDDRDFGGGRKGRFGPHLEGDGFSGRAAP